MGIDTLTSSSLASISAPLSSSTATTSLWPFAQLMCSGVWPYVGGEPK